MASDASESPIPVAPTGHYMMGGIPTGAEGRVLLDEKGTRAQSDDTYLTTVNLRQKFLHLKKFLTIREQPKTETKDIEALKSAINSLQEGLTQQKMITEVISEENLRIKKQLSETDKELDAVQETIMTRIILIIDILVALKDLKNSSNSSASAACALSK